MNAKFVHIIFLISLCIPGFSQTKYDLSFIFDGYNREYIVSVPTKTPPTNGWPLVVMLHGTSGDKDVFYNAKGWKELGQQENFVTVFPSSLRWCFTEEGVTKISSRWVNGNLLDSICPQEIPRLVSDIAFLKELVKRISNTITINPNKVFSSGFSNGSCMNFKAAMEAGDVFKASASTSGIYHELDSITPAVRIPIWFAVGTKDDRFIVPGYPTIPYGGDSIIFFFNKMIKRTLASQGLADKFTKNETAITKTYIYSECLDGQICAPFVISGIKNMNHTYPNGNNFPIDAPSLFWQFFNNPPKTTLASATIEENNVDDVHIYPNPNHQNTINIIQPWSQANVLFYNTEGRLVFSTMLSNQNTSVDISSLAPQLYIVHIENIKNKAIKTLKLVKI